MIVKRIYFPDNIFSQNRAEFKNILTKYGFLWSAFKKNPVKENEQIISGNNNEQIIGMYYSPDQVHKILYINEGDNKPITFFYKTTGSGGNFLIDINSFFAGLGCIIDTKNEDYLNNIIIRLHDHEYINIFEEIKREKEKEKEIEKEKEKNKKGEDSKKLDEFKIGNFDLKVRSIIRQRMRRYIVDNGESLIRRSISIKVALLFKKKDIQSNVRWGLENGWLKK